MATSIAASAQSCPVRRQPKHIDSGFDNGLDPSMRRSISGTIVYHENLRNWFSLRPDTEICGQSEFELWTPDAPSRFLEMKKLVERSRDCKATVSGRLVFGDRKEYASDIILKMDQVVPIPGCSLKPELLDNSKLKPKDSVSQYEVTMTVSLEGEGSVHVTVRNQNQLQQPWQAYMTYKVDGGHIFSATCGYGFVLGDVSSKPAGALKLADQPVWDVSPFSGGVSPITMTYTCTRVIPQGR